MERKLQIILLTLVLVLTTDALTLWASDGNCENKTYTFDADFDEGILVNVSHEAPNNKQLQLDSEATPFGFVWVAVSSEGTVVKIDTETGDILGEFRTTPSNQSLGNPSRTTVDNDGSVWVANRNNVSNGYGTVVHIGLLENGQCEDRNGNGVIDTSTGLGDVKVWEDNSGERGVATADDECICHYTQVNSRGTRHLSIDANNDVWAGGYSTRNFDKIKGGRYDVVDSGSIIRSEISVGYGGYGGLMDSNGVIWSAQPLLRWDVTNPLTGPNGDPDIGGWNIGPPLAGTNWSGKRFDSYGLGIDSQGNVWNTNFSGNRIHKYAPDGTHLGTYAHGSNSAQGCVADGKGDVWVAHSLSNSNTVGHLLNDGTYIGNVTLDPNVNASATGVAVDKDGKIWATGYQSRKVYRIDPTLGPIGADGVTPVGEVDFSSVNLGGSLYNYSDMTGSTLIAPPNTGTWTIIYDSGCAGNNWTTVKASWNSEEPGDSLITVDASSSDDGVTFGVSEDVTHGALLTVAEGQYLKVVVTFERSTDTDDDNDGINDSPILYDLTIQCNQSPDCSQATASIDTLWPPNHTFVDINVIGVTDPDGDPVSIMIDGIYQDEPVDTYGDGNFTPDGMGVGTDTAHVRAERVGTKKISGNGRVYHILFTASDGNGGECYGEVLVGVPHDQGRRSIPIDDAQPQYDSTALSP